MPGCDVVPVLGSCLTNFTLGLSRYWNCGEVGLCVDGARVVGERVGRTVDGGRVGRGVLGGRVGRKVVPSAPVRLLLVVVSDGTSAFADGEDFQDGK